MPPGHDIASTSWPIPTSSGVVAIVAVVSVGVLRPPSPLADLLFLALLVIVGGAFGFALRSGVRPLRIVRRIPKVATKGEALVLTHEVINDGQAIVRDLTVAELESGTVGSRTFFPQVPPGTRAEARTRMFLPRRGRIQLEGVVLGHGDPFGFFRVERIVPLPGEVLVQPRPRGSIGARTLQLDLRSGAGANNDAAEWATVREWRSGDPMRWIHWRATARRGFPVVRINPTQRRPLSILVLDRRADEGGRGELEFERAVSLVAGVGLELLARGGELRFLAPGLNAPVELDGLKGRPGSQRLLEVLALIEPDAAGLGACRADLSRALVVTARGLAPSEQDRIGRALHARGHEMPRAAAPRRRRSGVL